MNVINTRSPFFIEVNESDNIGSKIELFMYRYGESVPTNPTYTLTKMIPTLSQKKMTYNISGFISDYIDPTNPVFENDFESNNLYCFCKVKRYKLVSTTYTLLDTTDYLCLNGFNNYVGRYNQTYNTAKLLVGNQKYRYFSDGLIVDAFLPVGSYDWYCGSLIESSIVVTTPCIYKFPILDNLLNTCTLKKSGVTVASINILKVCEPKYTPVICAFINRYGGWQFLTFFKAKSESFEATSTDFNLLPSDVDYNVFKGQKRSFNYNGKQKIKLNTGWVDENYSEIIKDLLVSEVVLLDNVPAEVSTKSFDVKSSLKDKMINYEIDFEYAFNFINNVI